MIRLIDIIKEYKGIFGLEAIRDWVVDDYNANIGYNPDVNINQLLQALQPYKKQGRIYRVISVPKDTPNVKDYILKNKTDRYASFSDHKSGVQYFLPYTNTGNPSEKPVIISQQSEYYSLSDWYKDNFDKLEDLYQRDPNEYWWIDTNLPEVSNTGEAIARLSNEFEISYV